LRTRKDRDVFRNGVKGKLKNKKKKKKNKEKEWGSKT